MSAREGTDHLECDHMAHMGQPGDQGHPARLWERKILIFYGQVTRLLDEGRDVDVVYLDFSKTFNTVSRSIFLERLAAHGLDRCMLCWVKNWPNSQAQSRVMKFL